MWIISSDNETFTVEREAATRSVLIKNMIEGKHTIHSADCFTRKQVQAVLAGGSNALAEDGLGPAPGSSRQVVGHHD